MITAYCFQSNNHHIIAAALRMITGCKDQPPSEVVWHAPVQHLPAMPHTSQHLATSYHITPPQAGWVIAYPNIAGRAPFASALSRQARKVTIAIVGERQEAWQGGHPIEYKSPIPVEFIPTTYFYQLITPPVLDWDMWLHVWSPRWEAKGV